MRYILHESERDTCSTVRDENKIIHSSKSHASFTPLREKRPDRTKLFPLFFLSSSSWPSSFQFMAGPEAEEEEKEEEEEVEEIALLSLPSFLLHTHKQGGGGGRRRK